jgi:hypothetical protein
MPNPSELQRQFEEQQESFVANRNQEYRKLEERSDIDRLVALKVKIKTGYLSKSTKESLLADIRALEHGLGIAGDNYNSEEF